MLTALLAGEIDYMFDITGSLQLVRAGKLRALAVTSSRRMASMPDIPTIAESGIPNFEAITWFGFCAPSATPVEIVEVINREINAALKSPRCAIGSRRRAWRCSARLRRSSTAISVPRRRSGPG